MHHYSKRSLAISQQTFINTPCSTPGVPNFFYKGATSTQWNIFGSRNQQLKLKWCTAGLPNLLRNDEAALCCSLTKFSSRYFSALSMTRWVMSPNIILFECCYRCVAYNTNCPVVPVQLFKILQFPVFSKHSLLLFRLSPPSRHWYILIVTTDIYMHWNFMAHGNLLSQKGISWIGDLFARLPW